MAKVDLKEIKKEDLERYLAENSDFAFEMKVAEVFSRAGFTVAHSGTYEDPVTKKTREFDIRAEKVFRISDELFCRVQVAAECKNISAASPLVLHSVPRFKLESFNCVVYRPRDEKHWPEIDEGPYFKVSALAMGAPRRDRERVILLPENSHHHYMVGEWVSKSMDQVRIDGNDRLRTGDSEVFDKLSQAINSCAELVNSMAGCQTDEREYFLLTVPFLVVPDNRLWDIRYNRDSSISRGPEQINSASYFQDKTWYGGSERNGFNYRIPHLEISTLSALEEVLKQRFENPEDGQSLFGKIDPLFKHARKLIGYPTEAKP